MIDEAKLSELEELAKAATPGPWQKLDCGGIHKTGEWTHQGNVPPDSIICVAQGWNELEQPEPSLQIKDADRDYISAANPTAILSLIAAHRKALAENAQVKALYDEQAEIVQELEVKLAKAKEALEFYSEWESVTEDGKPRQVIVNVMYDGVPQATHALAEGSWLLTDWVRVYIRAEFLLAALRKAIEQRNDVLSGLTRSHLDDIAEYQEKNDAELLAILNVEGE